MSGINENVFENRNYNSILTIALFHEKMIIDDDHHQEEGNGYFYRLLPRSPGHKLQLHLRRSLKYYEALR